MKKAIIVLAIVLGGCYSAPTQAQRSEIIGIQNAIKAEVAILGSIAILNAPWSKEDVSSIKSRVDMCKRRLDQWAVKALEVAGP